MYNTISHTGYGEYEEKKSRFLGEALPVNSEDAVRNELARIRKQYYDARHHCYAYVLRRDVQETAAAGISSRNKSVGSDPVSSGALTDIRRSSDDGEPSGTAGAPILAVIDAKSCANVLIVVTRYFGGTLLGTGGLVRAYTKAASLCLADAGIVCMQEGVVLHLSMSYALYDKVLYLLRQRQIEPQRQGFGMCVTFDITVPADQKDMYEKLLRSAGSGQITIEEVGRGYYCF